MCVLARETFDKGKEIQGNLGTKDKDNISSNHCLSLILNVMGLV